MKVQVPRGTLPGVGLGKIIAIANQKGGVGKTTTAINLGASLAANDLRVLVIDSDPQGNATTGLGISKSEGKPTFYQALLGDEDINDTIAHTEFEGLDIIPSDKNLCRRQLGTHRHAGSRIAAPCKVGVSPRPLPLHPDRLPTRPGSIDPKRNGRCGFHSDPHAVRVLRPRRRLPASGHPPTRPRVFRISNQSGGRFVDHVRRHEPT